MKLYTKWSIKFEEEIFWLSLNSPDTKNAFNHQVISELDEIITEEISKNIDKIRVLVFTTIMDDIFTVGLDINWLISLNPVEAKNMTRNLQALFTKIENLPIPVIAAIKGLNYTAGFELMLCADIIIASENARFGQVETKWGLTPAAGATQRLIRYVGPLKAKELIYTSRIIDSQEALQIGLINEVVPLIEVENKVKSIAKMITNNSSQSIALCKQLINMGIYNNPQGFEEEGEAFLDCFNSGKPQKKLKSFLKRK